MTSRRSAPWQPLRSNDYFTADGQRAVIRNDLQQYELGSKLPHVILDDAVREVVRASTDGA